MRIDYLVVGQGLAGSLLAWVLIRRGFKVVIVDTGQENASQVAAGIINPISGLRFVKASDTDALLSAATVCYQALSDLFKQIFYIKKPMLRLFRSEAEANAGLKRLERSDYSAYLNGVLSPEHAINNLDTAFGGLFQKQTGYLLTVPLLNHLKAYFIAQGCYQQTVFQYGDLSTQPFLRWRGYEPQRIIFCEGYQLLNNPWFSWLPLQPVKGEILTLYTAAKLPDMLVNFGHWLLPLGNQQFRLGATFDRNSLTTEPTVQGRNTLLGELKTMSTSLALATVIRQHANIRPCTVDRQPFIGYHPRHPQLCVFNGFGAKGSMSIPWYSERFADYLADQNSLPLSGNIQRYYTTHFKA